MLSQRIANFSSLPSEAVIFSEDDQSIICWHPEVPFPYEYSKPLPLEEPKSTGLLKYDAKDMYKLQFKNDAVKAEALGAMTFTCKHRWFPRARDKRAKKTLPDRPYL